MTHSHKRTLKACANVRIRSDVWCGKPSRKRSDRAENGHQATWDQWAVLVVKSLLKTPVTMARCPPTSTLPGPFLCVRAENRSSRS